MTTRLPSPWGLCLAAAGGLALWLIGCQQPEIDQSTGGTPTGNDNVDHSGNSRANPPADGGAIVVAPFDAAPPETIAVSVPEVSDGGSPTDIVVDIGEDTPGEVEPEVTPTEPPEMIGPCPRWAPPLATESWTATASQRAGGEVNFAFDGRIDSSWATGANAAPGQWFQLDLGAPHAIERLQLDTGARLDTNFPPDFSVELAGNDLLYRPVANGAGTGRFTTVRFPSQSARYIKITLTDASDRWWRIAEIIVCGR